MDRDRVGDLSGFATDLAFKITEDATPYATEVHGDDGVVRAFDNAFHAPFKGLHHAISGDGTLCEDAHKESVIQRLPGRFEGAYDLFGWI